MKRQAAASVARLKRIADMLDYGLTPVQIGKVLGLKHHSYVRKLCRIARRIDERKGKGERSGMCV